MTDSAGVDWIHAGDAKKMIDNKYEDKHYKLIRVRYDSSLELGFDEALQELEFEVDDYMKNADDDYCPVGPPTIIGNMIVQKLVDEDYA